MGPDNTADSYTRQRLAQRRLMREVLTLERPAIALLVLQSLITALATIGYTVALAGIVADLSGYPTGYCLYSAMVVLGLAVAGRITAAGWMERSAMELGIRCKTRYQRQLLERWFGKPRANGSKATGIGSDLRLFDDGMARIAVFYQRFLPAAIQLAVIPPTIGIAAILIDWPTGLILLATGPLIPVFMVLIGWTTIWQTRLQWAALQELGQTFFELLRGGVALRALGCERWVMSLITRGSDNFRRRTMKVLAVAFLSALVLELVAMIGLALVAVQAGIRLVEGMLDFAPALAVLLLAPEFYLPFRNLGSRHHAGMEGATGAADLFDALQQSEPTAAASPERSHPAPPATVPFGLVVSNVQFTYPGQPRPAIRNFSMHIPEGTLTAIAGPSGAGKSTLARLILGLLDPDRGTICWRGLERNAITDDEWHSQFAWVPQQPAFFPGSLRDNLTIGNCDPGEQRILEVLSAVRMQERVNSLPTGLSTPVAEAALTFSVGERQRIAIARALLRNANLLILDEPTASLDAGNEQNLLMLLRALLPKTTVLVIAHRPATIAAADAVIHLTPPA